MVRAHRRLASLIFKRLSFSTEILRQSLNTTTRVDRIEEQCAEVVQLLVSLSDPEGNEKL